MPAFKAILKRLSDEDEAKLNEFRILFNASDCIVEALPYLRNIDLSFIDDFSSAQRSLSAIIDDLSKIQSCCEIRAMLIRQAILASKYDSIFDIGDKK